MVFTIPEQLNDLVLRNKPLLYKILFATSAATLQTIAADPRHLGARIGFFSVLHSWGQNLLFHPHIHCVATGGGISPDGTRWVSSKPGFFLPVRVLSRLFRRLFLEALQDAFQKDLLRFPGIIASLREPAAFLQLTSSLRQMEWVVYSKPPFGGPQRVLEYLGRYTHRVALDNRRILNVHDGNVTFQYKQYRSADAHKSRTMTVAADEFIRRFLLHSLPPRVPRIRHYGLFAGRTKKRNLARCRELLGGPVESVLPTSAEKSRPPADENLNGHRLFKKSPQSPQQLSAQPRSSPNSTRDTKARVHSSYKLMPQPHSTLEKDVQQILSQGTQILGAPAPRLLTGQPQVPANGLRHGLTGQNTFLSDPEMVLYLSSGVDFFLEMQPVGIRENHLLQRIIDADWRLNRVPFLQENLLKIGEFREAKRIRHDNPGASEQTVEVYARGGSFHDVSSDFEKIGRHEIRLDRLLNSMHHEYERRQESRRKHHSSLRFNLETCKGYLWYRDALAAAELMLESRRKEAQAKSPVEIDDPPITPTESVISEENLVCKTAPETMTQAHAAGLPIDLEKPAQDATITAETPEDGSEGISEQINEQISPDVSQDLAA